MRFCKTRIPAQAARGQCQWPRGMVVRWTVQDPTPPFSKTQMKEILTLAWSGWEAVCGIRAQWVSQAARANVVVTHRRIDGAGGVLAEAQLPCGNAGDSTQLGVWNDTGDDWVVSKNMDGRMIDLLRVDMHEFGHSLGLGHAPERSRNLMAPSISSIRSPQNGWDIPQSQARYGPPSETPPDEPPTPPDVDQCVETIQKCLDGRQAAIDGNRLGDLIEVIRQLLALVDELDEIWPQIVALLQCVGSLTPKQLESELKKLTERRRRLTKARARKKK